MDTVIKPRFVTLPDLARITGLPRAWLKSQAKAGQIPATKAGHRLMFHVEAVERAIIASQEKAALAHA